jgi:hypothetical protein
MTSDIITGDQTWRSPDRLHYSEELIAVPGIVFSILVRIGRWS